MPREEKECVGTGALHLSGQACSVSASFVGQYAKVNH
jgi:hypothetical protein